MLLPEGMIQIRFTPFKENFELDLNSLRKYLEYVSVGAGGLCGPCVFSGFPSPTKGRYENAGNVHGPDTCRFSG